MADIVQQQDEQRTARAFISFLSTALTGDQSLANQDNSAVNYPRQYTVIGTDRSIGIEGTSSPQGSTFTAFLSTPVLLIGAAVAAYFLMRD